jgi:type VI secretion system protein ImpJ
MRQLQPVLWTKGVLLTPQHLQTQDRFLEDLLEFQLSALTFCPWGFQRLNVDREALAGGVLGISQAAGILPDGLLFEIPDADPAPPPRPLETCWQPDQQTLDIYLAIPEYRYNGVNVSSTQKDRNTRYLAEVLPRRDENTGLAEKPLVVARKNFRILVEGEALEGSAALPVTRVVRSSAGTYQLDPRFVPPLVDVTASEYVMAIARRLVELLSAKSSALSDRRRQKNQTLAEFGIADVANFWLLYTVNTHLPQVRHLFEVRRGHPAELYEMMLSLAGALTTFSSSVHPRDLPPYDHANLSRCFTDLDETLRLLLETVIPANYVSLPMRTVRPAVYASAIERDEYVAAEGWYLALYAELEQTKLLRAVPELVKVSSADHIEHLIKQALPGLQLTHIPSPPGAIPVKAGYQYFRVGKTGPEWQAITSARNVAAYVPSELPNAQLELLVVLPTK